MGAQTAHDRKLYPLLLTISGRWTWSSAVGSPKPQNYPKVASDWEQAPTALQRWDVRQQMQAQYENKEANPQLEVNIKRTINKIVIVAAEPKISPSQSADSILKRRLLLLS